MEIVWLESGRQRKKRHVKARGFGFLSEELKNPSPVSDADPSIPRGLFHPNCKYAILRALRKDFSNIKSELNWDGLKF